MRQKKNREIKKGIPYTGAPSQDNINPTGSNTWGALPFYVIILSISTEGLSTPASPFELLRI